jgi:hypothetical protein
MPRRGGATARSPLCGGVRGGDQLLRPGRPRATGCRFRDECRTHGTDGFARTRTQTHSVVTRGKAAPRLSFGRAACEGRYGITAATRRIWKHQGLLPKSDVFRAGSPRVGTRISSLAPIVLNCDDAFVGDLLAARTSPSSSVGHDRGPGACVRCARRKPMCRLGSDVLQSGLPPRPTFHWDPGAPPHRRPRRPMSRSDFDARHHAHPRRPKCRSDSDAPLYRRRRRPICHWGSGARRYSSPHKPTSRSDFDLPVYYRSDS